MTKQKSKKTSIFQVPPLDKGIDTVHHTINIPSGFAQQLTNCQYKAGSLFIGRGGLEKINSSAVDNDIVDFIDIDGTYYLATASSSLYSMTTGGVATKIADIDGADAVLLNYNNDLIVCDGGPTKRYDGTHMFAIGSMVDTITDTTSDADDTLTTTKSYTFTTPNDGCYHNFLRITLSLKKVGLPQDVSVTVTYNGTDYETETVLGTNITTTYGYYDFDLADTLEVPANTSVTITLTATDTDGDNYFMVEKYSGSPMWRVNGQYAPKANTGTVWNGHLILTNDTDDQSKCYFSNVNLADDFWTENHAGYISFDDSTHSKCVACAIVFNQLALTGQSQSKATTTLVDNTWAITHRFTSSSQSKRSFKGSLNTLYVVGENGLSVSQGTDTFGDITFSSVSAQIKDKFDECDLTKAIIEYFPSTKQVAVKLSTSEVLYIFHTDGGQITTYNFSLGSDVPTVFKEYNNTIYIGTDAGHLYELKDSLYTDDGNTIDYTIISGGIVLSPFSNVIIQEFNLGLITDSSTSVACTLTLIGKTHDVSFSLSDNAADDDVYDTTVDVAAATTTHSNKISNPFVKKMNLVTDILQYKISSVTIHEMPLASGQLILRLIGDGRNIEE